jgi:hypothetical protein
MSRISTTGRGRVSSRSGLRVGFWHSTGNANIAEVHQQVLTMRGHEIFEPEIGKRILAGHASNGAGGEITKATRNLLEN